MTNAEIKELLQRIDEMEKLLIKSIDQPCEMKVAHGGKKQIQGVHSGTDYPYTWDIDENEDVHLGDYAIVQNFDSFALVKVVGITERLPQYAEQGTKRVIQIIPRILLEEILTLPMTDEDWELVNDEDY